MSAADMSTGFFGKIPATGDFVAANLPRTFIDRWDRWMSMELRARPDEGDLDSRVWRFTVPAGIFGDQPCAGAWRMSQDRIGRRYPFAIVRLGAQLHTDDPWFDAAARAVEGCIDERWTTTMLTEELAQFPPVANLTAEPLILFWRDDWEVQELRFLDIHDLAAHGLPAMRTARSPEDEDAS